MTTFSGEREATIQFSDTFGPLPIGNNCATDEIVDFDAALTAQVRNTHRFRDVEFGIGPWANLGDYGAVLLSQLRTYQIKEAEKLGISTENISEISTKGLHPDEACLVRSLKRVPVGVVNSAPRRLDHHNSSQNGDEFYVAVTVDGVEVYCQSQYLRGLHSRNLIKELYRIPNESGVWAPGEQFRSSCVTQARRTPEILVGASLDDLPKIGLEGRVAYVDTFGNVRLEVLDAKCVQDQLEANMGGQIRLAIDGKVSKLAICVVKSLCEIPEDQLGIYHNPADNEITSGPGYVELVKRVSDPNGSRHHAYAELVKLAIGKADQFDPRTWDKINIGITEA